MNNYLLCLGFVLFIGLTIFNMPRSEAKAASPGMGSYEVYMVQGSQLILKMDRNTGDTWRLVGTSGRTSKVYWVRVVTGRK